MAISAITIILALKIWAWSTDGFTSSVALPPALQCQEIVITAAGNGVTVMAGSMKILIA
jgi:hypothetical protein